MQFSLLKIAFKIGLLTTGAIVLYEISDQLLTYHYFSYSYYNAAIAVAALITGIVLTHRYYKSKNEASGVEQDPLELLTMKELQIMALICAGKSNKEIADLNYVELSTVKTHINNIYCKLGVKNRREAIAVYHHRPLQSKSTLSPPAVI
jgi:ATP/maltotriose-dependent transcriptional regulator MalT